MLRKSPYIQENYDSFYTKEWDRSNSLLNSQESITQALKFMQNLRLDHFDNSPQKDSGKDMMAESKHDYFKSYNNSQHMKQSTGAMIDISSQVNRAGKVGEGMQNQHQQHNKRSINYSAFDQTSSMLLQANQDAFTHRKPAVDNNLMMMKQILQNENHTSYNPQYCSYCNQHYDQILLLKRQSENQSKENPIFPSKKGEQKNKLDSFFVKKQKNQSTSAQPQARIQQQQSQQSQFSNMMQSQQNAPVQNQVQQTLFRYNIAPNDSQQNRDKMINSSVIQPNNSFNVQALTQKSEVLFNECKECNRTVCFSCCKQCQKCENVICPLPLCATTVYGLHEDVILCSQCVNNQ